MSRLSGIQGRIVEAFRALEEFGDSSFQKEMAGGLDIDLFSHSPPFQMLQFRVALSIRSVRSFLTAAIHAFLFSALNHI
jgi:hypothetical protein